MRSNRPIDNINSYHCEITDRIVIPAAMSIGEEKSSSDIMELNFMPSPILPPSPWINPTASDEFSGANSPNPTRSTAIARVDDYNLEHLNSPMNSIFDVFHCKLKCVTFTYYQYCHINLIIV